MRLRNKQGQVQMSETIAVLFIFFVLILFGIIFYYKYQQVSLKEKHEEALGMRAIETTLQTLFLPELQCTKGEAEPEDNCVDMMKVRQINETFHDNENYYYNIFSYSKVSITEIYPQEKTYILYDNQKPEWTRKEPTFFVIALRDEVLGDQVYRYGYLTVEVYS